MGRVRKIIVAVVIVVAGSVAIVAFWAEKRRLGRLTAEAPAQVTNVTVESRRKRMRTETRTRVSYSFNAGGRTIQDWGEKNGDQRATYSPGAPLKVCYNPSDPDESEIFTPDHKCGQ